MTLLEKAPQFIKGEDIKGKKGLKFKFLSEFTRGGDYNRLAGDIQVIDGANKYKENMVILRHADGTETHLWTDYQTEIIEDNLVKIKARICKTKHKTTLNNI